MFFAPFPKGDTPEKKRLYVGIFPTLSDPPPTPPSMGTPMSQKKILRFILCFKASWAFLVFTKMLTFWVIFMTGECGNIGTPPARLVLGPFNQYQVTQIDQISLPPYCKTCFSTSGWFWHAKKKHAKQTKKVGLGQTPPPSMGKIPTFYRFFSGEPPLVK